MTTMTKTRFEEIARSTEFAGIDTYVELCDDAGYWTLEFLQNATLDAKKSHVRRMIKTLKNDDGTPVFANIVVTDPDGERQHVYKQEVLFDVTDYIQVVSYHVKGARIAYQTALGYKKRGEERFKTPIFLPDPTTDDGWGD